MIDDVILYFEKYKKDFHKVSCHLDMTEWISSEHI